MIDEGIRVAAVCGPLTGLSAEKLKEANPAYSGAQLILINAPKVFNITILIHDSVLIHINLIKIILIHP